MLRLRLALTVMAFVAVTCGLLNGTPTKVPLDRDFVLAPGQSIRVDTLTVKFDRVADDSRCPEHAECVWEGDATVVVTLRTPSAAETSDELHTARGSTRSIEYDGYTIRLVGLDRAYRATLHVSR